MDDIEKEAKSVIQRIISNVTKTSAPKQILMGASSGWVAGFLALRVAKTAALALGGGIILLQVANEKGYININWDKFNKNLDKIRDKAEGEVAGEEPTWIHRTEKIVDKQLNNTKNQIKKGKDKAKKWYAGLTGDDCQFKDMHIFMVSFLAGVALGVGTS
ncbi:FUN14 domain-containing protein 1 [Leptinotarsa decemlineata]|uniref:FUN14 domain-containing protein 1 n=1 Tax=Leptinotarsa decemlineata TaxID=7539 RepID=UPI000C254FB6|nr:FUN14 domain-containing protein 1-like [Leptinotarsa decemlineata]XP_023027489.1 FUN14 domain-containing protein 1-like [Leptinotarsa decemlineata]